ncbi:MAG: DNA mismatch repair endonuclease MutL [Odoribacteraceae bacterium]|jgi:DNA mismatch repair protein MutL|nr:DNA mismatch repair endonuclease MutL [Odoribacteraceae bacterium]
MKDIIQLLPDSVANQIAAGEVVQRPASVVKELMENSIDAGATKIQIILKDAGKSRVQVIDDGKGMSPRDARMAFERHATSKIATAHDLFHIRTMGFRGEALASIASVAEVEVKTKRAGDELGTYLFIADSELKRQESTRCNNGTNLLVKNLFYTVPARRKFLKSDAAELRNIVTGFLRVALTAPRIAFTLVNNGEELYNLPASGTRQRVVNVFGKQIDARLVPVHCETGIVSIEGFTCVPRHAKKSYGEQFFFVNNRFMKHAFFHKAVQEAYSGLIGHEMIPSYFLYLTVDPSTIDVNIHPTKTEIKFQDETAIFQILLASIRESLGKFNITPTIDFDTEGKVDFPVQEEHDEPPKVPSVEYNPGYNPFHYRSSLSRADSDFDSPVERQVDPSGAPARWEKLFQGLEEHGQEVQTEMPGMEEEQETRDGGGTFVQWNGRYIVTPARSGMIFIDQKRAHERVLFERYLESLEHRQVQGQKSLFPETIEFAAGDYLLVKELQGDLAFLGFELVEGKEKEFVLYATPPGLSYARGQVVLLDLIEHYKNTEHPVKEEMKRNLALSMAKAASLSYNTPLDKEAMGELFRDLFACKSPGYTADGRTIVHVLQADEVNRWF